MIAKHLETLVGGFVLLGLLGLAFLALQAANLGSFGGGDTYALKAGFDNVGGLKLRAPVRAAGVTVGRIRSIVLDPRTFQGIVTLDIDPAYRFPRDTSARILTAGLLGDPYVGLEPGGGDKDLVAGDTVSQTQSAVVLENLIGQLITGRAESGPPAAAAASGPRP